MNIIQYLKPGNLPPSVATGDILQARREVILQYDFNLLFGLYTILFPLILIFAPQIIRSGRPWLYVLPYVGLGALTFLRSLNYQIRANILIIMLQLLGLSALLVYGLSGTGVIFLIGASFLASLYFRVWLGLLYALISIASQIVVGLMMTNYHTLPLPKLTPMDVSGNMIQWLISVAVGLFIMTLSVGALRQIVQGLSMALVTQRKLANDLEQERASLEVRVEERAADLKNRLDQFEIASQVAREVSGVTNLEKLLDTAVNLVRDRFGFYYVGLFIRDDKGEYAILRAGTGLAGQTMIERNHRLKIGEIGLVGYVVSRGEPRISLDVQEDVVHYKNPLLPDTRSEMALPLNLGDRTIGALDVQSVQPNAFSQNDVRILRTIADQLAIAFQKTQLLDQLQRSVAELENVDRTTTQKSWRTHLRNTRQKLAYRYHDARLETQVETDDRARGTAQSAIESISQLAQANGEAVLRVVPAQDTQGKAATVLAIPIKLRNQVLGVVNINFSSTNISPDLISLIEGTVDRLAVSLENARLLEEIQYRAERERLVGEISSKVRAAADVDSVLRIAIQEIGQSLGVSEVMVQLRKDS